MFCHECGSKLSEGALFCQKCGAKVLIESSANQPLEAHVITEKTPIKVINNTSGTVNEQTEQAYNNEKQDNRVYGDDIKPYYREQFARIASGEKAKFNWAAFLLGPLNQLFNGCTKIFCRTFLPVYIALLANSLIGMVATQIFNFTLIAVSSVLSIVIALWSLVLSIINGFKFNEWYYKDILNNPGKKRSRKGFWILLVSVIAVWIASLVFEITYDSTGKELEDTVASFSDADRYVLMVKEGYRDDNPEVTYEEAFSSFFSTPRWEYFKNDSGLDIVEFTGDYNYHDAQVKARIHFVVDEENGTFDAVYLALNELPQNSQKLSELIEEAFETERVSAEMDSDDSYGDYYDDYGYEESGYQNLDPALIGRWRSYEGGTLEFDSNGVITSCDFNCWSLYGEKPDRVTWETENGRVNCSAYFDSDVTYTIYVPSGLEGMEYIKFSSNDTHSYKRTSGENGDGIVGKWESEYMNIWSFEFNEDGTGMYNSRYPFIWSTYMTDDSSNGLYKTLVDSTYFDYSIQGNILTVFLSDSSRIYTKVGD